MNWSQPHCFRRSGARKRVTNTSPFNEIVLFLNPHNHEQDGHNKMTKIYSLLGDFDRESIV